MVNPRLRFKRADSSEYPDWEKTKLCNACNRFDNLRIPVAAALRTKGTTPYYGANGIQDFVDGYTHDGEFVLIAEDGASDLVNYPIYYVSGQIWVNNHAHVLQGKPGVINTRFLEYDLQNINMRQILVGSGRAKLNAEDMMKIIIPVPSLEEQAKIAAFLSAVDDVIAATSKEVADLELLKRGAMQHIFSRKVRFYRNDGSAYPRWKTTTLSKVVTLKKGQQIPKDAISETGRYEHMNGGTTASGRTDLANTEANTISISEGGNSCGHVRWNAEPFYSGGHNYTLRDITNETTAPYLYQCLKNQEAAIMRLRVGSGLPNIQAHALRRFPVLLPCLEEQAKIAEFLTAMDTAIAKAKAELDLWRLLKRGLTQQMFVVHANA